MKILKAISIFLFITFLAIGCGSGGGGGDDPPSTKTTSVSGTVTDINGVPVQGAVVTITSTPVTATTNSNGDFSATVEVGDHHISILVGTEEIYSNDFSCSDEPYLFTTIPTQYDPNAIYPDADGDGHYSNLDCDDNNANVNPGATEICDGIDNNCDGAVDEGVTNVCGSCGAVPTEICDGIDNNCDGSTDEGCICIDGSTSSCGSDIGECSTGTQTCVNGQWDSCSGEIGPATETCNDGIDQDCNGSDLTCPIPTLYNMADYSMPFSEGNLCTFANINDPTDDFSQGIINCFTYDGNPVCSIGSDADNNAVFSNDGTLTTLYYAMSNGEMVDFNPDYTLGYFQDGYSANLSGLGSYFMLRYWNNLDSATRSIYGIDESYDNIIVWATYDEKESPNSQNAIIESNLPLGVTPPNGAITDIEFHAPGIGLIAERGVSAVTGLFDESQYDLESCNFIPSQSDPALLVGTWEMIQDGDGDVVTSGNTFVVITDTTYSATRPDCSSTGTYTADGFNLTATTETAVGSDCGPTGDVDTQPYTVNATTFTVTVEGFSYNHIYKRILPYPSQITTNPLHDGAPDWNLTGSKIVFSSNRSGSYSIWSMDVDGSNDQKLSDDSGNDYKPHWSSNDSQIVFHSDRSGNNDIWLMDKDGSNLTQITSDQALDDNPDLSPNNLTIVFRSKRSGNSDIWIINTNGSGLSQLTTDPKGDARPSFSPDGSKIVFWSKRTGSQNIWTMDVDGSNQTQLTNTLEDEGHPHYSPDGSKIVFWSMRTGNREVWIMNADGSGQIQVTNNSADDGGGNWSPDGSKIVFRSDRAGNDDIWIYNLQ